MKYSKSPDSRQRGFTLIELLLYVSLVGALLITVSLFFSTSADSRIKNQSIMEVNDQGLNSIEYITEAIRNSTSVSSPAVGASGGTLTLVMPSVASSPTIFSLNGAALQVKEGSGAVITLTNSKVKITNLTFKNLSKPGTKGLIQVSFTLSRVNTSGRNEYDYQKNFVASAALR